MRWKIPMVWPGAQDIWLGGLISFTIISLWAASLVQLLGVPLDDWPGGLIVGAVLGRTFLHTGLFIMAHDAMHLSLAPQQPQLNRLIGRIAVWLYAFLPYEHCRQNHWRHHRHPAQPEDPDFHAGHPVCWYLKFIRTYWSAGQMARFVISGSLLFLCLGAWRPIYLVNILLFWLLPLVLSSVQLFFFGTYLPHREPHQGPHRNCPRQAAAGAIHSTAYPVWWSLLTCYHFGYHWEHHTYPHLPWYRLPAAYRNRASGSQVS
jgi:beta-carotene ketolase (CrtW type)